MDGNPDLLLENLKGFVEQLSSEFQRQRARLQDLELENARLRGWPMPVRQPVLDRDAGSERKQIGDEDDGVHSGPLGRTSSGSRRPSVTTSMKSGYPSEHRTWSQAFSSQGFDSEMSVVAPPPNLSNLRQLTRHSFESITNTKSAKFAAEQEKMQFMIMRAEKTRQLNSKKMAWVINPDSSGAIIWQLITSCCMCFVAVVTPIQVGLLELRLDALQITSWCIDAVFFVDMLLQFFTMYPKTTPRGMEWETNLRLIRRHYVMTWFPLDFVTLIPFDIMSLTWNASNLKELKGIKIIRAVRLLKLMRILKSSRWLHRLEIALSIPYQHIALLRFLSGLVLVCHWLSCFWAMCLHLVDDQMVTLEGAVQEVPKWLDEIESADAEFGIKTRDHPYRVYIASFYFCSYTMTSVGYGDLGPKNILERIVCTIIVLVAGLCWAQILGEVCAISSDMNADNQEFRKKMNSLNRMMQEQGLPHDLRRRLRSFFLQNRYQSQYVVRQKLLTNMSPELQSEVCTEMNYPWIQKVSFFAKFIQQIETYDAKGMDTSTYRACIADTSRQLICGAFAQRESFGNIQILYILSKGLVILNSRLGTNGTVWGEDFVLSDTSLIKPVTGFALTYIEVLALTREAFMAVIERNRYTCPELGTIVRRYCVRIAVRRGVIEHARRLARLALEEEMRRRRPGGAPSPPAIDELEVYSPHAVPGALWDD